jgi:phosphoribosyl-AMP cyclohydrolase
MKVLGENKGKYVDKIIESLKFDDKGLIPAVVQDWKDNMVLMVAYMNEEAIKRTLKTKKTTFWSRSRQSFWV